MKRDLVPALALVLMLAVAVTSAWAAGPGLSGRDRKFIKEAASSVSTGIEN